MYIWNLFFIIIDTAIYCYLEYCMLVSCQQTLNMEINILTFIATYSIYIVLAKEKNGLLYIKSDRVDGRVKQQLCCDSLSMKILVRTRKRPELWQIGNHFTTISIRKSYRQRNE